MTNDSSKWVQLKLPFPPRRRGAKPKPALKPVFACGSCDRVGRWQNETCGACRADAARAARRAADPERFRAYWRKWAKANPERVREIKQRYSKKKAKARLKPNRTGKFGEIWNAVDAAKAEVADYPDWKKT